jgi:hypothetical protein
MKKITTVLLSVNLIYIMSVTYTSAANATLVPSIHDEAYLGMSIMVDKNSVESLVQSYSPTTNNAIEELLELKVIGNQERSSLDSSTTLQTITLNDINSQVDLKNYIKLLVRNNPDIISVTVEGTSIVIVRNTTGKIFGLVPVPVEETASVMNWGDGTSAVRISRPWWNMFSGSYTDTEITKNLYTKIQKIPSSLFVNTLQVSTQGRIIGDIESTFTELSNK